MTEVKYDTIVVGGGIAGLTATTYLARKGQKVLLIEKNKELGGLVNTFTHNGFRFDAGVRALLDAGIVLTMLKDLNISLDIVKSPVSVGIEDQILNIEKIDSLWEYRDLLNKFYPQSHVDIDEVIRIMRKMMKHMDVLYGIENPIFKNPTRDLTFVFKQLLPWLPRFIVTVREINQMDVPVENFLKSIVKDQSLIDIISQHFFKKTPAYFALSYFSLYFNYFYPKGGVGTLSESLQRRLLDFGGEIRTETKITEVLPADYLVIDERGNGYKYKNLIWAADLKTLYKIARIENLPHNVKMKIEDIKGKLLKCRGGDSVFTLFVEVDEPLETFAKISHGHFFYTPSRKGLGETHREILTSLVNNFHHGSKEQVLSWLDEFIRLNTFEISIPGLKDPGMVPPGKTGLIISFLAEYYLFKKIKDAGWIEEFIAEIENRVISVLCDAIYPMLRDKIIAQFSFSPLSIENRVGSSEGGITGWAFEEKMPVINKIHIAHRSIFTPFPCIYQAGQWVYSPGGVPMSILTGKIAADKVLGIR